MHDLSTVWLLRCLVEIKLATMKSLDFLLHLLVSVHIYLLERNRGRIHQSLVNILSDQKSEDCRTSNHDKLCDRLSLNVCSFSIMCAYGSCLCLLRGHWLHEIRCQSQHFDSFET